MQYLIWTLTCVVFHPHSGYGAVYSYRLCGKTQQLPMISAQISTEVVITRRPCNGCPDHPPPVLIGGRYTPKVFEETS